MGQGAHERAGEPHAEVHALTKPAPPREGATLYCTLEPCAHHRPDRALHRANHRRRHPSRSRGDGRSVPSGQRPGIRVAARARHRGRRSALAASRGIRLNQPFLTSVREGRPFVILKAAASIDGRISAAPGVRTQITSAASLRRAQYDRAWVDAVGVGSETMLVDDPLLTVREVYRERPLTRVIFDRRLRTPPTARIFSTLADWTRPRA